VDDVEIAVLKGGREIDRIRRPVRDSAEGPAVTYRKRLWPLRDGAIDLDGDFTSSGASEVITTDTGMADGEDSAQKAIIARPPSDRVLVDAGPGTGKTHVACARVAALIEDGVPAARIWLISFTRAAVLEIRNRIALTLGDAASAASVRIATLDSHAWALQSGFGDDAQLTGNFDENIEQTLERIGSDEALRDYLERVRHLIVDEAQDIVGVRAELTLAMIDALDSDCGVTVFADEAQAIYGFTEESRAQAPGGPTLPERLRERGFGTAALQKVHRTSRPNLRTIFTTLRRGVMVRSSNSMERRRRIEHEIRRLADEDAGQAADLKLDALGNGALVLARRRADVLAASSRHPETPHRLRMSGLPACVRPWVGELLWDNVDQRLTLSDFEALWADRLSTEEAGSGVDMAWSALVEVAGETGVTVDLRQLRQVLGRSSPPMIFCSPEFGERGPILGTIHASKGREADDVSLFLPVVDDDDEEDQDEEIRVLFVGATRVRDYLRVGTAANVRAGSEEGRVWRSIKPNSAGGKLRPRVQVEIGRSHDLDAQGLVGRRVFADGAAAQAAQQVWAQTPVLQKLHARAEAGLDWDLVLEDEDNRRLGALAASVKTDLRGIAKRRGQWPPPGFLPHLRSIGSRTIVVRLEDPQLELLHEPWRSSGFLLAPLLTGFSPATFRGA
jgi:hypothetical protein